MNFGYSRLVKLFSPSGDMITVDLNGEEGELKELVSTLLDIPITEVKGLKDKYGNYLTFSSLLKRNHIHELNDSYSLILSGMSLNPYENYRKLDRSFNCNQVPTPRVVMNNSNLINTQYVGRNPTSLKTQGREGDCYLQRSTSQVRNQSKSISIKDKGRTGSIGNPNTFNNLNKVNSSNQNLFHAKTLNTSQFITNPNNMSNLLPIGQTTFSPYERSLQIAKELNESNLIQDKFMPRLQQLILEENEEVFNLFRLFQSELIELKTLANSLNKVLKKGEVDKRPKSPTMLKHHMITLMEGLQFHYEDPKDVLLLKQLIEYDNEFIMAAFEVYESDNDLENFLDSTKRLIRRYKKSATPMNNFEATSKPKNNSKRDSLFFPKENLQQDFEKKIEKPIVPFKFEKEVETSILSKLHTEQKCIFLYALKYQHERLDVIIKLYETFKNEEIIIRPIKEFCKNFIQEKVTRCLNTNQKEKFESLLKKRDKALLKFFTEFASHNTLETLEENVVNYIKKDSQTKISISVSSEDEEVSSMMKIKSEKELKQSTGDCKQKEIESKIEELIKMIGAMNFSNEEKEQLLSLLRKRDQQAMNVLSEHFKTGNMISIRPVLVSLLKRKQLKNDKGSQRESSSNTEEQIRSSGSILKSIKQSLTNKSIHQIHNMTYKTFEKLLVDLDIDKKISSFQHSYLLKRYKLKDEVLLSSWEVYLYNNNIEEIVESLKIFLSYKKKNSAKNAVVNVGKTPAAVASTKNDLMDFLRTKEKKAIEKIEVKKKQKNIIELLARENMIDRNSINLINNKIDSEDDIVTSAFEIFSVTKDHWEFCETLNMITEIYNNLNETKRNPAHDTKDDKLLTLFENFLNKTNSISEEEKTLLKKKYENKDEFLMSALELYETGNDEEDFIDTLRMILKKKK